MGRLSEVRRSAEWIKSTAVSVKINKDALNSLASALKRHTDKNPIEWDNNESHLVDHSPEDIVQYLFVLDALNSCFWPSSGKYEYDDLARLLREAFCSDSSKFSALSLSQMRVDELARWLGDDFPNLAERCRIVREIGSGLQAHFHGSAFEMVQSSNNSAEALVHAVTAHFPAFRDEAIYQGGQVAFYKRAQIFTADVAGALPKFFKFDDIEQLTMFADYRIPQLLRDKQVLEYAPDLAKAVDSEQEIDPGCAWESEIRGCTIYAVSALASLVNIPDYKLDWLLWQMGESTQAEMKPHHRVRTIYY